MRKEVLLKAQHYCAYQERCIYEVKNKLLQWGIKNNESEKIIARLIEDDFLNEARFVKVYAHGKFSLKKWGKIKIRAALKLKHLSEELIQTGLNEISEADYLDTLRELLERKSILAKEKNYIKSQRKLAAFAISKGYESNLVWEVINSRI
ncbi:RecX family transcriptional regulator [Candidatus Amoebophilus asiaticus]|nr:RecX family transcriptional regulator [Candidatus Amoebophilus asiaticus]